MGVERVERGLRVALGAWAALSTGGGLALLAAGRRDGRPGLVAFGAQSALWGAVDGALAGVGAVRARRGRATGAARLRRLLVANAAADAAYVAVGAALVAAPARRGRQLRAHGAAVVVQGAWLLAVDTAAAARLRPR